MTIDQAIFLLRERYNKVEQSPYVKYPLNWALNSVLQDADDERKSDNEMLFNQKGTGKSHSRYGTGYVCGGCKCADRQTALWQGESTTDFKAD